MKKYIIFGKNKQYTDLSWFENFMSGHISIDLPFKSNITFYGENAMHWAVNIRLFRKWICFRLPFRCFDKWWSLYLYISKDGTPSRAIFKIGNI